MSHATACTSRHHAVACMPITPCWCAQIMLLCACHCPGLQHVMLLCMPMLHNAPCCCVYICSSGQLLVPRCPICGDHVRCIADHLSGKPSCSIYSAEQAALNGAVGTGARVLRCSKQQQTYRLAGAELLFVGDCANLIADWQGKLRKRRC